MKKLLMLFILISAAIAIVAFVVNKNAANAPLSSRNSIRVIASFYPLAEFTKHVGGENVEVVNIVPSGIEPHDFEPTPQDIARMYSAKVFIFNGSGLDPWAEAIAPELEKKGVTVIRMTERVALLDGASMGEEMDPHIWLDPILAQKEVAIIRDMLQRADSNNANNYAVNAEKYSEELSALDKKYREGLASCAIRDVVTSHRAFDYLAKRYTINAVTIAGLSPEEEPSPKKIAEIAQFAREKNITYIFFETLASAKLAETIAREIGVETLVLNPLEGLTEEEVSAGKNYISVMEENLVHLRMALLCT